MTPRDNEHPPRLDDIDALIAAARRSIAVERQGAPARRAAAEPAAESAPHIAPHVAQPAPAPPAPAPAPAPPPPAVSEGFEAMIEAMIEEALQPVAAAPAEGPPAVPAKPVEEPPAPARDEPAPPPERIEGVRGDQVDVLLRRVTAMLDFVESAPAHGYDRATTSQLLRELTGAMRQLRDRSDHAHQQLERWLDRWRAAEIQAMETARQISSLIAIQDQQTSLLLMARRLCVQEAIFVEWRAHNAWVVLYEDHVLTLDGQWEPDRPTEHDGDFARRTRLTLSEAVTRARSLRLA